MSTYFWADLHFNHAGILKYTSRAYADVEAMNEDIVWRWNRTIQKESDIVWVLGDFAFRTKGALDLHILFNRLRGRKSLIIGNHDERNPEVLRLPWERQERLVTFRDNGRRAELCHYPLESWKGQSNGALMLHGHCHGNLQTRLPRRFEVGFDVEPWPILWDDLLARASES